MIKRLVQRQRLHESLVNLLRRYAMEKGAGSGGKWSAAFSGFGIKNS